MKFHCIRGMSAQRPVLLGFAPASVLKKLSFPGSKVLHIELNEKQVSGRVITLSISYHDILNADTLPLH